MKQDKEPFDDLFEDEMIEPELQEESQVSQNNEDNEYQETLKRLEEHCSKTWICLPLIVEEIEDKVSTKIHTIEIDKATPEEFFAWLCLAWPPAIMLNHSPEDYVDIDVRSKTFVNVVTLHKYLKLY